MRAENYLMFLILIAGCPSHWAFEQIGDGYYYIGNEKISGHYFDWFIARRDCWRNLSNLVSVESPKELKALEDYIVSRGYPDGSTFATSGHNFNSVSPYSWEGTHKPLDFTRWAPGSEVSIEKSYLSLELSNSSLYMRRSYGQDDYFICEYRLSVEQVWQSLSPTSKTGVFLLGCLALVSVLLAICIPKRKSSQRPDYKVILIPKIV